MTTRPVSLPGKKASKLRVRYLEDWKGPFLGRIFENLKPGIEVLDVGGGSNPTLPRELLPESCTYVGLDLSERELARAAPGSYDEVHVGDIAEYQTHLAGRFDLVISWQVLEHVKSLDASLENIRSYLRPGGRFIAQFSGAFSMFGLINRAIPRRLGVLALQHLLKRDPDTVFPAYYHHCWHSKVSQILCDWHSVEIVPRYRGATYFKFSEPIQHLYLLYEDWAMKNKRFNLATHYVVDAQR